MPGIVGSGSSKSAAEGGRRHDPIKAAYSEEGQRKGNKNRVLPVLALVGKQHVEAGQSKEDMTPAKKPILSKDKGKGKKNQALSA